MEVVAQESRARDPRPVEPLHSHLSARPKIRVIKQKVEPEAVAIPEPGMDARGQFRVALRAALALQPGLRIGEVSASLLRPFARSLSTGAAISWQPLPLAQALA